MTIDVCWLCLDNCKKLGLVFENAVGIVEIINSKGIQLQVRQALTEYIGFRCRVSYLCCTQSTIGYRASVWTSLESVICCFLLECELCHTSVSARCLSTGVGNSSHHFHQHDGGLPGLPQQGLPQMWHHQCQELRDEHPDTTRWGICECLR